MSQRDVRADAMRVSRRRKQYSQTLAWSYAGNFSATVADSLRPKDSHH